MIHWKKNSTFFFTSYTLYKGQASLSIASSKGMRTVRVSYVLGKSNPTQRLKEAPEVLPNVQKEQIKISFSEKALILFLIISYLFENLNYRHEYLIHFLYFYLSNFKEIVLTNFHLLRHSKMHKKSSSFFNRAEKSWTDPLSI